MYSYITNEYSIDRSWFMITFWLLRIKMRVLIGVPCDNIIFEISSFMQKWTPTLMTYIFGNFQVLIGIFLVEPCLAKSKYAVLKAKTAHTSQHFCMVYFPEFKKLPSSPEAAIPLKLVNATKLVQHFFIHLSELSFMTHDYWTLI